VGLWGRNLTNKEYPQNLFPNTQTNGVSTEFLGAITSWAAPRSYGVSASYEF